MTWTASLIKIRTFEVDLLKKRVGEAVRAYTAAEDAAEALERELAAETNHARADASVSHAFAAFRRAWIPRKTDAMALLRTRAMEEQGCRDALAEAYAELKKVETIAAGHAVVAAAKEVRIENGRLDEIALRRHVAR